MIYCKVNNSWVEITAAYKKENGEWSVLTAAELSEYINGHMIMYGHHENALVIHTLMIGGTSNCFGETGNYVPIYNGKSINNGVTWNIVSGSSYATISQNGELTILPEASESHIIIGIEYKGLSATKNVIVTYEEGTTSETETETEVETNESGQTITTTTTTTTTIDASGNTTVTETITQIVENEDGSLSSIAQETETGSDGTVTSNITTVNYDENGDLTGSQTNATVENPDGSSTSLTTNFDENGNATDSTNLSGDTEGNVSTQQVEYDESGTPIVTGFQIDTSNGSDGNKNFNTDGLNTEYYAFDVTAGFELIMHFTINFANQPANQNDNHHQILNMKRADPSPWYGFQLRHSKTNKNIQLGTQFSTGSNTNTNITGAATASANTAEYNLKITYDPRLSTNSFICKNLLTNQNVYTSNLKFPDLEELKYIKVTIGYAMQSDGTPYRYSNINVIEFSIEKILYPPVISYEENVISIALNNSKGDIYYKLNQTGNYLLYTSPISIKRDSVVESYVSLYNRTSNIASATCVYESIVVAPIINYDYNNHIIELSCETEGADIYYDLNHTGNYTLYTSAITITATTYIEAYAYLAEDDLTSNVVSTTCVRMYDPTIECDGEFITITTITQGAEIYYKLGQDASYTLYESPIQISADTITYAYSSFSGYSSNIVSATCIWDVDISAPVISFNHNIISLNCDTFGANIYYKFNIPGNYELYSEPLEINEDTTIFAFAELNGESSTTVSQLYIYTHYYEDDYLTFNILSSGTINWMSNGNLISIANIQYSINGGQWTWTSVTDRNVPEIISVNEGDSIRFKGNNSRYGRNNNNFNTFSGGTAIFNIEGNIMSLIYGDDFIGKTSFSDNQTYRFSSLFRNNNIISAEHLVLPVTSLTPDSYSYMFYDCTSLTAAPEIKATTVASASCQNMFRGCTALTTVQSALPATTLADECYSSMFSACTSLTAAPELPATTLVNNCYANMFNGCTALTTVQSALPATVLPYNCYNSMFYNCKSLTAAPEIKATTVASASCKNMFNGCTSLTAAPELPATTLADNCYEGMFVNCTSLTAAPELPATTLANNCYNDMFSGCSNLSYIKCMATSTDTITITNWTKGVSNTGAFVRNIDTTWSSGDNGIPNGWAVYSREVLYAPVISNNNGVVEITCTTSLATIYYRINNEGNYSEYTSAITITNTTIFESYSELDGIVSDIVSAICVNYQYLTDPEICCDGKEVFITSPMYGVNHYYKFYEDVNYTLYTGGLISISADTVVIAYSEFNGISSNTVSDLCVYDVHNYEQDYLTFRILSDGVINWKLTGSMSALTIQYSKNGGEWTSITANETPSTISVVEGDVLRFKGENSYYAVDKATYNGFYEGTATYNAEGNIMSLVYGDNFIGQKALTSDWEFSNLFRNSKLVSAKNLVMPATALTNDCYRAMFANSYLLTIAPDLPATTLTTDCYYYMFDYCVSLKKAPDLIAPTVGNKSYYGLFWRCASLSYINCLWTNPSSAQTGGDFSKDVSSTGIFVKYPSANWIIGTSGIPSTWTIYNYGEEIIENPVIDYANNKITITCNPQCVDIFYKLNQTGNYALYSSPILITGNTVIETYSRLNNTLSNIVSATCVFINVNGPVINCDGEYVTITNENSSTDTYYKLNQDSGYTLYSIPLEISANTIVYAYSDLNGTLSDVVSSNCEYYITLRAPVIDYNFNTISITCRTTDALVYYKFNELENYNLYLAPIEISADTTVFTYSELSGESSTVISGLCTYVEYDDNTLLATSNRSISSWTYNNQNIVTPYSVNAINGHTSAYTKGTYNFTTSVELSQVQPTYLWFQHADQSADIFVDDVKVETHWGGYNAFFSDITNFVHSGTNNIKVALCNTTRDTLAPADADFNFNATLGNVKLLTSPVLPSMKYGYDGFHVTSDVSDSSATITVKTTIPLGAEVKCSIDDNQYHFVDAQNSTGKEMIFSATVQNPHLWNGKADPHLYNIKLEIYYNGNLYHRFERGYGLRYYSYVINDTSILPNNESYTGFLLNGTPYLLRGVCMHDDIEGKANALTSGDVETTFAIIQELGCNFIRLAHYPHPKEVYDKCDELGIVVQTEVPCVNKLQSSMPPDYYTHLTGQYEDMVNQHYNHPCIMFWGLSNETTTDDKEFARAKIEGYVSTIKALDSERMAGCVMLGGFEDPYGYYNNPAGFDWVGTNIYEGWYNNPNKNNPTSKVNIRLTNTINKGKALAYSEYGCGGTQRCHSESASTTTDKGAGGARHDIEYMMWLHEGHIAAIKNFPQLLFVSQWQLFDVAVSKRKEGYIVCVDGETTSTDENLKYLNDKGLVERDHITKKDTFYLYKAEWSDDIFVHICGKDYTRMVNRVIKCYTNDGNSLSLYVNNTFIESVNVTNHIATFTSRTFYSGDVVRVESATTNDTFTFA